ncbi:hypothetical protein ScPMuIL_012394 [Solemya velum]
MSNIANLKFDNLALRVLPVDSETENYVRQVTGSCFSRVFPTPVESPAVVCYSESALGLIDLTGEDANSEEYTEYFSGNKILPGSETAAHCYCGHQFGIFAGQLGDGAAVYLGEVINKSKERWEIQLKGSGKTPFSRHADGRKVLRSSIREFLGSEAMHHLGIPSTRAGSCVTSETLVERDIFYNGNPVNEKCTIILRLAPTFLRFGSFEIFKLPDSESGRKGPSVGRTDVLHRMLKYTIQTFFPQIWEKHSEERQTAYLEFFKEVIRQTARLVSQWQCVGWCHGVLNTDNMSIVGLTIDYGPFGFLDRYDPDFICNSSDKGGRYAFNKQPEICQWNLRKLAQAIQGAIPLTSTEPCLSLFEEEYETHYHDKMRKKFGFLEKDGPRDIEIMEAFLDTMQQTGADFTNSFRCLSRISLPGSANFDDKLSEVQSYLLSQCCSLEEHTAAYQPKLDPRELQMIVVLMQTNPALLPAIGYSYETLARELKNAEKLEEIKQLTPQTKLEKDTVLWTKWLKSYTERLKQEVAPDLDSANQKRVEVMNANNPRFILRNYIAQNAIEAAEQGDFQEVKRVLRLLENPYCDSVELGDLSGGSKDGASAAAAADDDAGQASGAQKGLICSYTGQAYDSRPPTWAQGLHVT